MPYTSNPTEEEFYLDDKLAYLQQIEHRENRLELLPRVESPTSTFKNTHSPDKFPRDKSWSSFAQIVATRTLGPRANNGFLQGPRRVFRLFFFGFLVPVLLIAIPLYVRLILLPPYHQSMAPTDQRLFNQKTSGFWCRAQSFHMNGSFNAFLMREKPPKSYSLQTHTMLKRITLKDDFKEYWGFYLQKGSSVTFRLCNRYDGGILMILKGAENLRRCAWIGEEDSAEQDEDNSEESNEIGHHPEIEISQKNVSFISDMDDGILKRLMQFQSNKDDKNKSSDERRAQLDYYIDRIFTLSKNEDEIVTSLNKKNGTRFVVHENEIEDSDPVKMSDKHSKYEEKELKKKSRTKIKEVTDVERMKRSLDEDVNTGALEELDENEEEGILPSVSNVTEDLYTNIFHTPEGLVYKRGTINQTYNHPDYSNEEHRSSYSSSEEALASCEGLLGAIPLYQDRSCSSFNNIDSSIIKYPIAETGTYYFIFSSDNEVFDSDIFLNMTIERVVYNTSDSIETCKQQQDCYMPLSFWSYEQTVVEVPEDDGWDHAYIIGSRCQPRIGVYLAILILIPIFILFCAGF